MNDADDVARRIAEQIVRESRQDQFRGAVTWCSHLETWITAALREYGEAEYRRGYNDGVHEQLSGLTLKAQLDIKKFQRGDRQGGGE